MDRLILDFGEVINWITLHKGTFKVDHYATALSRSVSIRFPGSFNNVNEFLGLNGVRRALIAYWNEALIRLKEKDSLSLYARFHNWNAVAQLYYKIQKIQFID